MLAEARRQNARKPQAVRVAVIALGIDVGPTKSGWALLESLTLTSARFVAGGMCPSTAKGFRGLLSEYAHDVLSVEHIAGGVIFRPGSTRSLLVSAETAGFLLGIATATGRYGPEGDAILCFPAASWRRGIIGKTGPKNDEVKRVIKTRIRNLPKRFSNHVADACGVGLYGIYMTMMKGIPRR